jgi:hypothetical protein
MFFGDASAFATEPSTRPVGETTLILPGIDAPSG